MIERESLLRWFDLNQRPLPWRAGSPRDPYAVWISEAMLQQTTVKAVIPYFERWMTQLPNVCALADASEETVLALWQGLGYYRRARNLHAASKIIAQRGGVFPRTRSEWLQLPGVGEYTAGAVCSIALGMLEPLVDGNVERVFARLTADGSELKDRKSGAAKWARENLDIDQPGKWNEALMELGATICTPRSPSCHMCPVQPGCRAFALGEVERYPAPQAPRQFKVLNHQVWIVRKEGQLGLLRAQPGEWWAGLYHPPRADDSEVGTSRLSHLVGEYRKTKLGSFRHVVTHHKIAARVYLVEPRDFTENLEWFDTEQLDSLPISAPGRRAIAIAAGTLQAPLWSE